MTERDRKPNFDSEGNFRYRHDDRISISDTCGKKRAMSIAYNASVRTSISDYAGAEFLAGS